MADSKRRTKRVVPRWLVVVGAIFIVGFTGVLLARVFYPQLFEGQAGPSDRAGMAAPFVQTAEVITLTAVTTIESSGTVEPLQLASVFWDTTGQVAGVHVDIGDFVEADQVLLSLDPQTVPQSVVQAQVDLVNAQNSLAELLNPSALQIATAQSAVAQARETLEDAHYDLNAALHPAGQALFDAVADAELAFFQAQADAQLANVNADQQALAQAAADVSNALAEVQRLQQTYDDGLRTNRIVDQIANAQARYEAALDARNELLLRIDKTGHETDNAVGKAQAQLQDAVANLNFALLGPDALKVEQGSAGLAVAQAELADAEAELAALLSGADPDEIVAATAALLSAQRTLDTVMVRSPFDGEVLDLGYRQGDLVDPGQYAALIANTSLLHLAVLVDENNIGTVAVGQPATLEFAALPGVSLKGVVSHVGALGKSVDGIVRYDVEVTLLERHPDLRLGMTADVVIVTEVAEGTLAIPLDALQFDDRGEYVLVFDRATQTQTRVDVVTGQIIGDYTVMLAGELAAGQRLALPEQAAPAAATGGFGSGGGRGPFGGGGG